MQGLARHKGSSLRLPCHYYLPGPCDIQSLTYALRASGPISVKWEQWEFLHLLGLLRGFRE